MDGNCKEFKHDFNYNLQEYESCKLMLELSDGIFHDFKNILSNISGLTQLSLLKAEKQEVETNLESIYRATTEFKDALDSYHNLMRGNLKSNKIAIQLNGIIARSLKMVQFKFYGKKLIILNL